MGSSRRCFGCCGKKRSSKGSSEGVPEGAAKTDSGKHPTKWRAIKVVMLTTGCFVVTWLPYFIASTMYVLCDPATNAEFCRGLQFAIASPLAILGFTNSLLNPVIYAWWHRGFRTSARKLWRKMCPCCCRGGRAGHKSSASPPDALAGGGTASPIAGATTSSSSGTDSGTDQLQQQRPLRSSNATASTTVTGGSPSYSAGEQGPYRPSRSSINSNRYKSSNGNAADLENRITNTLTAAGGVDRASGASSNRQTRL